jgi:hypothetical protein
MLYTKDSKPFRDFSLRSVIVHAVVRQLHVLKYAMCYQKDFHLDGHTAKLCRPRGLDTGENAARPAYFFF